VCFSCSSRYLCTIRADCIPTGILTMHKSLRRCCIYCEVIPQSSRQVPAPLFANVSSWALTVRKFSMGKPRQLTNREAPFAELGTLSLAFAGRNIRATRLAISKLPTRRMCRQSFGNQSIPRSTYHEAQAARHPLESRVYHTEEKTNYTREWPEKGRPIHWALTDCRSGTRDYTLEKKPV
jgi:hypothetical protein